MRLRCLNTFALGDDMVRLSLKKIRLPRVSLKRVGIAWKAYGGFGAVVALIVVISGVGAVSLSRVAMDFAHYLNLSRDIGTAADLQSAALRIQSNVRQFMITGDITNVIEGRAQVTKAGDAMKALAGDLSSDQELSDALAALQTGIGKYSEGFEKLITLQLKRNELMEDALNRLGAKIERDLSSFERAAGEKGRIDVASATGQALNSFLVSAWGIQKTVIEYSEATALRSRNEGLNAGKLVTALAAKFDGDEKAKLEESSKDIASYNTSIQSIDELTTERDRVMSGTVERFDTDVLARIDKVMAQLRENQEQLAESATARAGMALKLTLGFALVATVIGSLLAVMMGTGIARPVKAMTAAMRTLANGDTSTEIPARNHGAEIGAMAEAVQVFKDNLIRNNTLAREAEEQREAQERMAKESAARAEQRAERARQIEARAKLFEERVGGMLAALANSSGELRSAAEGMATIADQTRSQVSSAAKASDTALGSVQMVASATDQLASSIQEISKQVSDTAHKSSRAVDEARSTRASVEQLKQSADKIGEIIETIGAIAGQTNMLALNATIEAARAGAAGKGFAVVASEVKALANQTAKATDDIAQRLHGIQQSTGQTVGAIGSIVAAVEEISEIAGSIAAAVEEQSAATNEISRNVGGAREGATGVNESIGGVRQVADETGGAASKVLATAESLGQEAAALRTEVHAFLEEVKAA
jgi:methyl-accepting chemotaxis protein